MKTRFLTLFLAAALLGTSMTACDAADKGSSPAAMDKESLDAHMREFIMDNPELLLESVQKYQSEQRLEMAMKAREKLAEHGDMLSDPEQHPHTGNTQASVTVVEFFDYNCGYCKKAFDVVQEILKEDSDLLMVFIETPILSESSEEAARWALAAEKQDAYFAFHSRLMAHRGAKGRELFLEIAEELGLDGQRLEADANAPEVAAIIENNLEISRDIGVSGTPAFMINGRLFPGYLGDEQMAEAIKAAREEATDGEGR